MKDLTNKRYGRLVVKEYSHSKNGQYFWKCDCDCGTKGKLITTSNLQGKTRSCGCLHAEMLRQPQGINKFIIIDDFIAGITEKGEMFYFDLEDFDLLTKDNHYWFMEDGYVRFRVGKQRKRSSMHRILLGLEDERQIVDHINGRRFDNRRCNIRIANKSTNGMNRDKQKNNRLGIKGIYKNRGKYVAAIGIKGKRIHLGVFDNLDDAIQARKLAEIEYFGEFRYNQ